MTPDTRPPGGGIPRAAEETQPGDRTSHRERNRPARIEVTSTDVLVIAPFNRGLVDALKTLPGARFVPAHWSIGIEYIHAAEELITEVFGPPVIHDRRGGGQ